MADGFVKLNPTVPGGAVMDEETVDYTSTAAPGDPALRNRSRVVVAGRLAAQIAEVLNSTPSGAEYALVVRAIISALPLPVGAATDATLQAILAKIDKEVVGELPAGAIDGIRVTFTTAYPFKPGSTKLYLNSVRQAEGPTLAYIEGLDHQSVTFVSGAPHLGDALLLDYIKA